MNNGTFSRLLDKTKFTFEDRVVKAEYENKYYYLEATFDVPNNKIEIDFQQDDDESIILTEDQEETLLGLMYKVYKENIYYWKQENKTELQREAKLSQFSASDRLKTLRSNFN